MGIAAHTPELDRIERDVSEAERADRIEQRYRVSPSTSPPELTAAQLRAKELRTRLAMLEAWQRTASGWAGSWRNSGLDIPSVTVGIDATLRALKAEQEKLHEEQMGVGFLIQKLQGSK